MGRRSVVHRQSIIPLPSSFSPSPFTSNARGPFLLVRRIAGEKWSGKSLLSPLLIFSLSPQTGRRYEAGASVISSTLHLPRPFPSLADDLCRYIDISSLCSCPGISNARKTMSGHPSSAKPSTNHRCAAVIQIPPPQSPAAILPRPTGAATSPPREYRKGNWTLHETLALITAKRLDDDRRKSPAPQSHGQPHLRSAEQRWKWVENYCWNHECFRSQNQCNDKWDNLLRDYKKVRDYEATKCPPSSSYWSMEKHERKERNLPSNLVQEVFNALTDVLTRRNAVKILSANAPSAEAVAVAAPPQRQPSISELSSSSEAEGSEEREESCDGKRRRVHNVGASVVRGASVLARALVTCEERRSQRHQQLLELEERRLRAEEHRAELHRQGLAGLIDAVNSLAGAVNALVSHQEMQRR